MYYEIIHDYKMVDNRSTLEHAHELRCFLKELELMKWVLLYKFVIGCSIVKIPPS